MSEFFEPDFKKAEFLEHIDSDLLNAITEYDVSKKKYFALAATIRNDLPSKEEFEDPLEVSSDEISYSFGEFVLATYESYGLDESKEAVANLWYHDQGERANFMSSLVACSNTDCHEMYTQEEIQDMVDGIFKDSFDEDTLLMTAKAAYFDMLRDDAQGFANHIEGIRNKPNGFLVLLDSIQLDPRFNTALLRRRVAKLAGSALVISASGAVVSKFFGRKEQ